MDKYEYRLKAEQIEKLIKKKDYVKAAEIADTIDWRRVKNVNMLYAVSEIYEMTERYGECMELLDMAYDRAPVGRMLLYRMVEVCTKMHNFDEAISLYREFVRVAPHDQSRYILKYQIYRERGSSVEDQIKILCEYKTHEYQEKWAYELAALYDEAGMQEECVRECDELILWFSEGEYVAKALTLKQKYEPLTEEQQEKYRYGVKGAVSSICKDNAEEPEIPAFDPGQFNTMNLQAELAGNLNALFQEDATIELPDLVLEGDFMESEEAEEEPVTELAFREDGTIELPELGLEGDTPEEAEEETIIEPDFREDGTIELPELNLEGDTEEEAEEDTSEEPKEKLVTEPDFREDGTIELPELNLEGDTEEEAEEDTSEEPEEKPVTEPDFREDGTIELPELNLEGDIPEKTEEDTLEEQEEEHITELDFRENRTIELPELDLEDETVESLEKAVSGSGSQEDEMTEPSEPEIVIEELSSSNGSSEPGHTGTDQLSVDEILDKWEEKKAKTEALLEAGAKEEQKRREKVKQETAELIKLIEGISDEIPEDVQQILQEADEERKAREATPVVTEDDLPPDLEEETEEEEELSIEIMDEEAFSGSGRKKLSGDTTSLNMIQELERSLASEVSEMAVNAGHLTEEQARLFAYFTSVKGMSQQLSVLFKGDSRDGMTNSSRGNLIVTGKQGNGKTTLAIDIVKALQKQHQIGGNKLAKISGQKLNTKDVYEVITRLKGGALIIESAGGLSDATMMALSLAMETDTGGLLVILEDSAEEIKRLFHKNKNFASKFEHSIDIPVFTNDELVAFGISYAQELEYSFDEFGKLALYDRIGSRQTNDHLVTVAEVKEIIDSAIEHAEKGGIRHLLDRVIRRNVDEFGNRLLREADFME